jgi:hypothetical protein
MSIRFLSVVAHARLVTQVPITDISELLFPFAYGWCPHQPFKAIGEDTNRRQKGCGFNGL